MLTQSMIEKACPIDNESIKKWKNSIFERFILNNISTRRGKIAEILIEMLLEKNNISFIREKDNKSGYDFIINNKKIELKYSSEDKNGNYTFHQVRIEDNRYDGILFMMISPKKDEYYYVTKEELKNFTLSIEHSGQSNACCLSFTKKNSNLFKQLGNGCFKFAIAKIKNN